MTGGSKLHLYTYHSASTGCQTARLCTLSLTFYEAADDARPGIMRPACHFTASACVSTK